MDVAIKEVTSKQLGKEAVPPFSSLTGEIGDSGSKA